MFLRFFFFFSFSPIVFRNKCKTDFTKRRLLYHNISFRNPQDYFFVEESIQGFLSLSPTLPKKLPFFFFFFFEKYKNLADWGSVIFFCFFFFLKKKKLVLVLSPEDEYHKYISFFVVFAQPPATSSAASPLRFLDLSLPFVFVGIFFFFFFENLVVLV